MSDRERRTGELYVFLFSVLNGLFPLMANIGAKVFPPILYAAMSNLLPGIIFFTLMRLRGITPVPRTPALRRQMLGVILLVTVLPSLLIFIGTRSTSGLSTSLLLQSELVFSLLIFHVLFGDRITRLQFLGAVAIFLGTAFVLYRGAFSWENGDLLIILACVSYPLGNRFAKLALATMSPIDLLYVRGFFGGLILLVLSLLFERPTVSQLAAIPLHYYVFAIAFILLIYVASRLLWYEGFRRLPLGKAIYIASASPIFSLLFSVTLFHERPTSAQLVGFVLTLVGLFFLTHRSCISPPTPDVV